MNKRWIPDEGFQGRDRIQRDYYRVIRDTRKSKVKDLRENRLH